MQMDAGVAENRVARRFLVQEDKTPLYRHESTYRGGHELPELLAVH